MPMEPVTFLFSLIDGKIKKKIQKTFQKINKISLATLEILFLSLIISVSIPRSLLLTIQNIVLGQV